jgi:hypothetical protein
MWGRQNRGTDGTFPGLAPTSPGPDILAKLGVTQLLTTPAFLGMRDGKKSHSQPPACQVADLLWSKKMFHVEHFFVSPHPYPHPKQDGATKY